MKKDYLIKFVIQSFIFILFIVVSTYILLSAYGYQIDLLNRDLIKTTIVDVQTELEEIEVYFDDELISNYTPYQVKNVSLEPHDLLVTKEGFNSFNKKIIPKENFVSQIKDIILIPTNFSSYKTLIFPELEFNDFIYNLKYVVFISHKQNKLFVLKSDDLNASIYNVAITDYINPKFINEHEIEFNNNDEYLVFNLNDGSMEMNTFQSEINNECDLEFLKEAKIDIEGYLSIITTDCTDLLYLTDYRELFYYDVVNNKKSLLGRFSMSISDLSWFVGNSHFVFELNEDFYLCDLSFENCNKLISEEKLNKIIPLSDGTIIGISNEYNILRYDFIP